MISVLFYLSALVALVSAILTVTRHNAIHALLYLVVTMMAISLIFFLFGAPFASALQVIVYAGAIMVLFVFVTMMLHQGDISLKKEQELYKPKRAIGAAVLCIILLGELIFLLSPLSDLHSQLTPMGPREVGLQLFGPYMLLVEIAALLLLSSLVGAFHIGRRHKERAS